MNYRVFHTHSSCVHDWEFDFSGVLSINKQGYGLIPNLGALPACVRKCVVHRHCMLTTFLALNAMYYEPSQLYSYIFETKFRPARIASDVALDALSP